VNPTYDTEPILFGWILLRWQFFREGKQFYADRVRFELADWTDHTTAHAAPGPSNTSNWSDNQKRDCTASDHFFETFFATVTCAGSYPSFSMVTTVFTFSGTTNEHGVAPTIPLDNVTRAPVGSEFMKRVSFVVPRPVQQTIKASVTIFIA
jgi:hypothetical protein